MRAIVNGKLYDTEKAARIDSKLFHLPVAGNKLTKYLKVYKTASGNIFAESVEDGILLDADEIKRICNRNPKAVDAYIEIFGTPEEA